jgi:tight adherence protein B
VLHVGQSRKIAWLILGAVVSAGVLWIFYERWYVSLIVGIIGGVAFVPIHAQSVIKKRQKNLMLQFKEMLESISTSLGAGKNVTDAFIMVKDDLKIQFSEDADIIEEVNIINRGIQNNFRIEDLLYDFADRSCIKDVQNFAAVFGTCYEKGGNIKEVIKNTVGIINDKIEIQMEIDTMVAGEKNEQNIMMVMPVVFVAMLKSMGGDLIDLKSGAGVMGVTAALIIFIIAYFVGRKILNIKL